MSLECELCGCPIRSLAVLRGPIKICPDCGVGAIIDVDPRVPDDGDLDGRDGADVDDELDIDDDYVHADTMLDEQGRRLRVAYSDLLEGILEVPEVNARGGDAPSAPPPPRPGPPEGLLRSRSGAMRGSSLLGRPRSSASVSGDVPVRPRSTTVVEEAPLGRGRSGAMVRGRPRGRPRSEAVASVEESALRERESLQQEREAAEALETAQRRLVALGDADAGRLTRNLIAAQLLVTQSIGALAATDEAFERELIQNELNDTIDKLFEGGATFLELVAIADAINANIDLAASGEAIDPAPFLTSSNWASLGGIVLTLVSTANLLRIWSTLGTGEKALKGTQALLDIAHKGAAATTAIASWSNPAAVGASVANVSSAVGSALGIVISTINYAVELKTAADMQLIKDRYNHIKKGSPKFRQRMSQVKIEKEGMDWLLYKITRKVRRRKYRAGVGAGSAAFGALGSGWALGGTIAVIAGGAACVPVVGWVCLGVSTVGAFGLLGYKIGRRQYKKSKLKKYRDSHGTVWVPRWIATTGEFNRFRAATFIHASCCGSPQLSEPQRRLGCMWAWVLFGNTADKAVQEAQGLGIAGIMAFIKG